MAIGLDEDQVGDHIAPRDITPFFFLFFEKFVYLREELSTVLPFVLFLIITPSENSVQTSVVRFQAPFQISFLPNLPS